MISYHFSGKSHFQKHRVWKNNTFETHYTVYHWIILNPRLFWPKLGTKPNKCFLGRSKLKDWSSSFSLLNQVCVKNMFRNVEANAIVRKRRYRRQIIEYKKNTGELTRAKILFATTFHEYIYKSYTEFLVIYTARTKTHSCRRNK